MGENSGIRSLVRGSLVRGFTCPWFQGSLVRGFTCPGVHLSVLFVYYNFLVRVCHSKGPQLPGWDIRFDIPIFRSMYGDGPPLLGVATPTGLHSHGSLLPGRYCSAEIYIWVMLFCWNIYADAVLLGYTRAMLFCWNIPPGLMDAIHYGPC